MCWQTCQGSSRPVPGSLRSRTRRASSTPATAGRRLPVGAGSTLELQVAGVAGVPSNVDAVALNMTVVNAQAAGFATGYPCGQPRPEASNLNYAAGQTIPNLVIARPGTGGKVCIYSYSTSDVLADLSGFFPAGSGFTPVPNPTRILDTRNGIGTSTHLHRSMAAPVRAASERGDTHRTWPAAFDPAETLRRTSHKAFLNRTATDQRLLTRGDEPRFMNLRRTVSHCEGCLGLTKWPRDRASTMCSPFSDEVGGSHFEDIDLPMSAVQYAPPAPAVHLSPPVAATEVSWLRLPIGTTLLIHRRGDSSLSCSLAKSKVGPAALINNLCARRLSAHEVHGNGHGTRPLDGEASALVVAGIARQPLQASSTRRSLARQSLTSDVSCAGPQPD